MLVVVGVVLVVVNSVVRVFVLPAVLVAIGVVLVFALHVVLVVVGVELVVLVITGGSFTALTVIVTLASFDTREPSLMVYVKELPPLNESPISVVLDSSAAKLGDHRDGKIGLVVVHV